MKKFLGTLSAIAALMTAIAFVGCKQPGGEPPTMKVDFEFEDFTVSTFTVTAYNGLNVDDGSETVQATVTNNGSKANCVVSNTYVNGDGWLTLKVVAKDDEGTELDISVKEISNGEKGAWFEFAEDETITIIYQLTPEETGETVYEEELEGDDKYPEKATVSATVFAAYETITAIKVKVKDFKATEDKAWWANVNTVSDWDGQIEIKKEGTWDDDIGGWYYSITDSSYISAVKEKGLFVVAGDGSTFTLEILVVGTKASSAD